MWMGQAAQEVSDTFQTCLDTFQGGGIGDAYIPSAPKAVPGTKARASVSNNSLNLAELSISCPLYRCRIQSQWEGIEGTLQHRQ